MGDTGHRWLRPQRIETLGRGLCYLLLASALWDHRNDVEFDRANGATWV